MKLLPLLLVLTACSTASIADLYRTARSCGTAEQCPDEWAAWNKAEERRIAREQAARACPEGYVQFSKDRGEITCVTRENMESFLQRLQHGY